MEEWMKKPNYSSKDEIAVSIGRVLWGNKNKKFSMLKLIFGFIKKPKKKGGKK
jgi:hypothetical protein